MKKIMIVINLVFLFFLIGCNLDEDMYESIINNEIIEILDTKNKIFMNVIDKDKMRVPLEQNGYKIIWDFDNNFFELDGNLLKVKQNGTTIVSATFQNKIHLFNVKIQDNVIKNTVQYNLNFYYSFISDTKKIGKSITPNKIVIHNTANTAPASNEIKWLNSNDNTSSTSFHYAVDDSGVYQAISTNKAAYHAGNLNINNTSIGIEIAKSKSSDEIEKDKGIKNTTILVALLLNYFELNINSIITHKDASGKYCPHDLFDRYGYEKFIEEIINLT